jgi:SAM-dependent methyltransferase
VTTAGSGSPSPSSPHFFEAIADHAGAAYLRYSFTRGTDQEVSFLWEALGLRPGARVLDVGCGPGRHSLSFAARGAVVCGVDISERFVRLAHSSAVGGSWFARGDARRLPVADGSFDAAICLCQGGFGLLGGCDDAEAGVVAELARAVRPGGRVALTAFSSYFAARHLEDGETFDASSGVVHEQTSVLSETGVAAPFELWTTCFTPRELRLLAAACGLVVEGLWSVRPGAYDRRPLSVEWPELLLLARRPPPGHCV